MTKLRAVLITVALGLATASCMPDGPPVGPPLPKPDTPPQTVAELVECRTLGDGLAGRMASIYRARDAAEMYVLVIESDPTCATDEDGVNLSRVVPIEDGVDPTRCPVCDGEPMPAAYFPGLQ